MNKFSELILDRARDDIISLTELYSEARIYHPKHTHDTIIDACICTATELVETDLMTIGSAHQQGGFVRVVPFQLGRNEQLADRLRSILSQFPGPPRLGEGFWLAITEQGRAHFAK